MGKIQGVTFNPMLSVVPLLPLEVWQKPRRLEKNQRKNNIGLKQMQRFSYMENMVKLDIMHGLSRSKM